MVSLAGIAGWGSAYGKAGFGTAIILLALTTFFVPVSPHVVTGQGNRVESVVVSEEIQTASHDR